MVNKKGGDLVWLIVLVAIVVLARVLIIELGGLDGGNGTGLIINIISGVIVAVVVIIFVIRFYKHGPKTRVEAEKFEHKGIYNPIWVTVVWTFVAMLLTLGNFNGSVPLVYSIVAWVIVVFFFYPWVKLKFRRKE